MTDRELAGRALLPCNFPCEKCGSQDIARAFRPEGEKWRVEVYGRAASKYAYADAYVATSSRDHINHRCRCCQYEWQTLPMKKQRRNRRTPSSDGDGRDAERYRRWRLLAASGTMSEAVCEMMIAARTEDDIDAAIDAAIAAAARSQGTDQPE